MVGIMGDMRRALEMAGGSVGFTAIFLAGVIGLWYGKFEKKAERVFLFWYSLLALLTVINPIYIKAVRGTLPQLYYNNYYLWILPLIPVIVYSCASAVKRLGSIKMKIFFIMALLALLVLASTTSFTASEMNVFERMDAKERKDGVVKYISYSLDNMEADSCLIWGESQVMERARQIDGRIKTLYGKDKWQQDGWDDKVFDELDLAYEIIKTAPIMQDKLLELAIKYDCDYIILSVESFENMDIPVPDYLGKYALEYSDGVYIVYCKEMTVPVYDED